MVRPAGAITRFWPVAGNCRPTRILVSAKVIEGELQRLVDTVCIAVMQ